MAVKGCPRGQNSPCLSASRMLTQALAPATASECFSISPEELLMFLFVVEFLLPKPLSEEKLSPWLRFAVLSHRRVLKGGLVRPPAGRGRGDSQVVTPSGGFVSRGLQRTGCCSLRNSRSGRVRIYLGWRFLHQCRRETSLPAAWTQTLCWLTVHWGGFIIGWSRKQLKLCLKV